MGEVPFGHPTYMNAESIVEHFFTSGVISEMWGDEVVHDILGGSSFWSPHIYERVHPRLLKRGVGVDRIVCLTSICLSRMLKRVYLVSQ